MENREMNIDKAQLLKKVEPFQSASQQDLNEIALHLEEIEVKSGHPILKQGDSVTSLFVLVSGKVEMRLLTLDDRDISIGVLSEPGDVFGETALLTNARQEIAVVAKTDCRLLAVPKKEFFDIIHRSPDVANAFVQLMMSRHRPKAFSCVTIHELSDSNHPDMIVLKNEETDTYFKISKKGLFVFELLNGERSFKDIAEAYHERYQVFAEQAIQKLVSKMMYSGFVSKPTLSSQVPIEKLPLWIRVVGKLGHLFQYNVYFKNIDTQLTWLYQKIGYLFYKQSINIVMAIVSVIGFIVFMDFLPLAQSTLRVTPYAYFYLVLAGFMSFPLVIIHELAHALTTKYYGRKVKRMGVGWFWLAPMAFTDTSDMWLCSKGPRMVVSIIGVYSNVIVSGVLAVIAWMLVPVYPLAATLAWLTALASYLMAFYNLDPIVELDGYYFLMHWLDVPNLRAKATKWLINDLFKSPLGAKAYQGHLPEAIYWMAVMVSIFIYTFAAYLIYINIMIYVLPEQIGGYQTSKFKIVLVVIILGLSFLSVYSKIKKEKYLLNNE